ncbi:MAG TPA: cell division protein ZapA [Rhizomicrobium sp.]|jgi:cell division protein ZapA|nr:cell division protein ZapA [Rhizomicrobium sp.]
MPLVNIMVNNRAYTVACDEGEEDHLRELGGYVDSKVNQLLESVGQVGDGRLILMAALLIADELHEATSHLETRQKEVGDLSSVRDEIHQRMHLTEGSAADALESAAKRLEDIAARLPAA